MNKDIKIFSSFIMFKYIAYVWFGFIFMFLTQASDDSDKDTDKTIEETSNDQDQDDEGEDDEDDEKDHNNKDKNKDENNQNIDTEEDCVLENNKTVSKAILKILDIVEKNPKQYKSLNEINKIFQKYYYQKNKERYEMVLDEPEDKCEKIIDTCLKDLNFSSPKWPEPQHINKCQGILLLGATVSTMIQRIDFLKLLLTAYPDLKKSKIYLLTGRRPLTSDEKKEVSVDDEGEAFQELFQKICPDLDFILVYSSNTGMRRATTESTFKQWLELNPLKGTYISISSEPFVIHQTMVFRNSIGEDYTTIGAGPGILPERYKHISVQKKAAILMDALSKTIYEMAQWQKKTQQKTPSTDTTKD